MLPSLLILQGNTCEKTTLHPTWKAQIDSLAHRALPIFVLRTKPLPTLCLLLERRERAEVRALLHLLRQNNAAGSLFLHWQTFFALDKSVQESFLVITSADTPDQQFQLRFLHSQHGQFLEAIAQSGQVAITGKTDEAPAVFPFDASELSSHLTWIQTQQMESVDERAKSQNSSSSR